MSCHLSCLSDACIQIYTYADNSHCICHPMNVCSTFLHCRWQTGACWSQPCIVMCRPVLQTISHCFVWCCEALGSVCNLASQVYGVSLCCTFLQFNCCSCSLSHTRLHILAVLLAAICHACTAEPSQCLPFHKRWLGAFSRCMFCSMHCIAMACNTASHAALQVMHVL